ncbi:MAG: FAD-dependent oxidoreductase [Candidatus Bathyarchaeia archaeon]
MSLNLPEKWDYEADIVVIGAGTAGLPAAIEARKRNNEVIILEKAKEGEWRSSLSVIVGLINFAGTKYQKEKGIVDSPAKYAEDGVKYCGGDPAFWKVFTDNHLDTLEFIERELGLKPRGIGACPGHSAPRGHYFHGPEVLRRLEEKAKEVGINIMWGTPAKRLYRDPVTGRVIGVIAEKEGKLLNIRARKAVIICTGGFGRNDELIKEYGPDYLLKALRLMPPTHTGDGLIMAMSIGAATRDIKHAPKPSLPTCIHKHIDTFVYYFGGILVNKDGKRFISEDLWYGFLSEAGINQPGGVYFIIYDDAIREKVRKEYPMFLRHYEYKANTIEELAKMMEIDPKGLKATIEKYNKDIETVGYDTVFNRRTLDGVVGPLVKIEKPPFYGMKATVSMTSFKGGIRINTKGQVLDWNNNPIPGLYAAGECTGGFFSAGKYLGGTMTSMSMTMGRVAAIFASQESCR